jgi:hypothetical protein
MELQEVDVFIDKKGNVSIEVRRVKGTACIKITDGLEKALGGEIITREMTNEAQETVQEFVDESIYQRG